MESIKTMPRTQSVIGNASGVAQIGANPHRVAILLSTPVGASTFIVLGAGDGSNVGPVMPSGCQPLLLTRATIGSGIIEAIQLVDSGGASKTYGFTEFLLAT